MIRRLFKTGNSLVVALPREALDALRLKEGSQVSLEIDPERSAVVISAAAAEIEGIDADFARQVADFIQEYRPALEALAR